MPQRECGKRSSIIFFVFRDAFGHFSVTFSDASVTFFRHFFAELLLPDSFCGRVNFVSEGSVINFVQVVTRTMSEYCSVCVSRAGVSTK